MSLGSRGCAELAGWLESSRRRPDPGPPTSSRSSSSHSPVPRSQARILPDSHFGVCMGSCPLQSGSSRCSLLPRALQGTSGPKPLPRPPAQPAGGTPLPSPYPQMP